MAEPSGELQIDDDELSHEFDWRRAVDSLAASMDFPTFLRMVADLRHAQTLFLGTRKPEHMDQARHYAELVDDVLEWGFR